MMIRITTKISPFLPQPTCQLPMCQLSTGFYENQFSIFLHNPPNKQTNADENITSSVKVTSADFAEMN